MSVIVARHVLRVELLGVIHDKQDINDLLSITLLIVGLLEHSRSVANGVFDMLPREVTLD